NGTVQAFSAGPNQGSEFIVRLPVAEASQTAKATGNGAIPDEDESPTRRILVVDDSIDAAESLALLLRLTGHEIQTCHDGPAALDAFPAFEPEVVLLDIGLPKMDGYAVARALRQLPGGEKVLLVALTGYGQEEDRIRAAAAGFDHHLTKPVDLPV